MNPSALQDDTLFGEADAGHQIEVDGLKQYFVSPPGYDNILRGSKTIIVARKGMGKTAIQSRISERKDDQIHIDIEPLEPNHPLFSVFARSTNQDGLANFTTYDKTWRSYAIAHILNRLSENGIIRPNTLPAVIAKHLPNRPSFTDRIQQISAAFGGINFALTLSEKEITGALPSEFEIPRCLDFIQSVSQETRKRIVVTIDKIDQRLEEPLADEKFTTYANYMGGLCLASARIAAKIAPKHLSQYIFLREDLLNEFRPMLHSATEFDGLIFQLNWSRESLMDMLALRLSRSFQEEYTPAGDYQSKRALFLSDKLLYKVFEKNRIGGYELWDLIVLLSQFCPRNMIKLCNFCRTAAGSASKGMIDGVSINKGMIQYSRYRYTDLVATHLWMVSSFRRLIDSFRGRSPIFTYQEMISHLQFNIDKHNIKDLTAKDESGSKPERILQFLYRVGFIVSPVGPNAKIHYISSEAIPNLNVEAVKEWRIHPAFAVEMLEGKEDIHFRGYMEG